MGKKHYSQPAVQVEETEVTLPKVEEPAVVSEPEVVEEPKPVIKGYVADCVRLNVRSAPSTKAKVLCEIACDASVVIDMDKSKKDWYSVCTEAGVNGFCMKKYIQIPQ